MNQITNDTELKHALQSLDPLQQRTAAALFVEHVLSLSDDKRLGSALKVAIDGEASAEELAAALKSARSATMDSHTRCGSEGNWTEQAGYFVARATVAALTPGIQSKAGGPAWQAAMSARMAQTSALIDQEGVIDAGSQWQYELLDKHMNR